MARRLPVRAIDWAEVRRVYEAGEETVVAIRARFALSDKELRQRREAEEWITRPPVAVPGPNAGRRPDRVTQLSERLLKLARAELVRLERRRKEPDGLTAEDAQAIRDLAGALRTMKTGTTSGAAGIGSAGGKGEPEAAERAGKAAEGKDADHAAFLRAELKKRLDRLRRPARP